MTRKISGVVIGNQEWSALAYKYLSPAHIDEPTRSLLLAESAIYDLFRENNADLASTAATMRSIGFNDDRLQTANDVRRRSFGMAVAMVDGIDPSPSARGDRDDNVCRPATTAPSSSSTHSQHAALLRQHGVMDPSEATMQNHSSRPGRASLQNLARTQVILMLAHVYLHPIFPAFSCLSDQRISRFFFLLHLQGILA